MERQGGRPIGVLLDLQGPKLRIGTFSDGSIQPTESQAFRLDLDTAAPGSNSRVLLPHPEIFAVLEPGAELLLNNGRVHLRVERCGPGFRKPRESGR